MGEAAGGLAEAGVGALEIPLKVSQEVREWKKYQHDLSQGGVDDAFDTIKTLLPETEAIKNAIKVAYKLDDSYEVFVDWGTIEDDFRLIPFRAVKTKSKIALKLHWQVYSAKLLVRAAKQVKIGKKTYKVGDTIFQNKDFGAFINNIGVDIYGTHINKSGYNFDIAGEASAAVVHMNSEPMSQVRVRIKLATSISNKKVHGQGNEPKTFAFTIKAAHSVTSAFAAQGAEVEAVDLPLEDDGRLKAGTSVTADQLVALYKQSLLGNQAKLFGMPKDGAPLDVWAWVPPTAVRTKGVPLIMLIGDDHDDSLRAYITSDERTTVATKGTITYKKSRRHPYGEWAFTGLTAHKDAITEATTKLYAKNFGPESSKALTFG